MPSFFPHQTVEWKLEEPRAFRRFSFSLVEMAAVTGLIVRVFRLFVLTHGSNSWLYLGGAFTVGLVLLIGMATAHLANFPIRQWLWRAPLFALIEVASEMATSLVLTWLGREPNGTVRADYDDWISGVPNTLFGRGTAILLWSGLLAAVVQLIRRTAIVQEDKDDSRDLPAA
jgi:hypothetical protein